MCLKMEDEKAGGRRAEAGSRKFLVKNICDRVLYRPHFMLEREFTLRGRVQLVMFRDFACRRGRAFGLVGFARNNADGSLTVVAQGEKEKLEKFEEALKKGPIWGRVDSLERADRSPARLFSKFVIEY